MHLVPVLDLMIGQIVLAQSGNRDAYRPVCSRLTGSSYPLDVARAIFNQTGCQWLYVADIDSFAGAPPNWRCYNELLSAGFGLWIDADWMTDRRYLRIRDHAVGDRIKIIVSSETLSSLDQFAVFETLIDDNWQPIFSLDKKGDDWISQSADIADRSQLELIRMAHQRGVRELIVLDLCEVGTGRGFNGDGSAAQTIAQVKAELPDLRITSGGGVRNLDDLRKWVHAGCDHVLVASAIHAGAFTPDMIV